MRTLQTTWVEPAYLEPDAAWCEPGGVPASSLGNGGAFGGKMTTEVGDVARRLADQHGRAVRVLFTREDVVRRGPKRPPIAAGVRADGTGIVRVARTPGIAEAIGSVAPGLVVEEVDVVGSADDERRASRGLGGGGRAAGLDRRPPTSTPDRHGDRPERSHGVGIDRSGRFGCTSAFGAAIRSTRSVLRSYCTGAAHMALGWVRSEGLAIGDDGTPLDLTIRSFGVLRAVDTPPIHIVIEPD